MVNTRFVMPAEWAPHTGTWLSWPHNADDWPGKLGAVSWAFGEIVRHLCAVERVSILVQDTKIEQRARKLLHSAEVPLDNVHFIRGKTNRAWLRDSGPSFVFDNNKKKHAIDWRFNAWAKYSNWRRDDTVATLIAKQVDVPVVQPQVDGQRVVLEGGAIDVDGAGTLLATEECLLGEIQQRNPDISREELESVLGEMLGAKKIIWLGRGIVGDDTHGHVDDLCRFVAPGRVVLCHERDTGDENYEALAENLERLESARDVDGEKIEVISLPMPTPLGFEGHRLPASYANFYVANDVVLVPTFNDVNDRTALGILSDVFPGRRVVGIHAVDLVWGFGTIHCLTQQEPQ